jgi:hypothetical protein
VIYLLHGSLGVLYRVLLYLIPVNWTSLVGVEVVADSLVKTAADGWGNASAVSSQVLSSGDGYVQVTASDNGQIRMFGLSKV